MNLRKARRVELRILESTEHSFAGVTDLQDYGGTEKRSGEMMEEGATFLEKGCKITT